MIKRLSFLSPSPYIEGAGLSSYDDKRAYNKQAGPGGGTQRLHHNLLYHVSLHEYVADFDGAEIESTDV